MIENKKQKRSNKPNRINDTKIVVIIILFHYGGSCIQALLQRVYKYLKYMFYVGRPIIVSWNSATVYSVTSLLISCRLLQHTVFFEKKSVIDVIFVNSGQLFILYRTYVVLSRFNKNSYIGTHQCSVKIGTLMEVILKSLGILYSYEC